MRRVAMTAAAALALVAMLGGCVTKAAGEAVKTPGRIVGGLLGA